MRIRKFIIGLGCAAPVVGSYYIVPRYTLPFDFYDNYFIFIIIHLFNILSTQKSRKILPNWLVKGFSIFILSTIIASFTNPQAFNFAFFKQLFGGVFSASSYYIVFRLANFNLRYLFVRYLNFAFLAALFSITQEILHLLGYHIRPAFHGSFGLYRVDGLSGEPYNLSLALFPAMFFYLSNLLSKVKQNHESRRLSLFKSLTVFLAFFLTFSSTGYIGLFIAFFIIAIYKGYFNIRKPSILLAPIFFGIVYLIFSNLTSSNSNFNRKVDDGLWFLRGEEKRTGELNKLNSSTFVLVSNFYITMEGFKENPIAGIGLGNYEILYNQKFDELFGTKFLLMYGRGNYNDANSMFLRLLAETGIIGICIFLAFIFRFLIKRIYYNTDTFYLVVINHGIFILMLIRLLRCGNYLSDGMFFFLLFYFYSFKQFQQVNKTKSA